jgi:hypothetical protein
VQGNLVTPVTAEWKKRLSDFKNSTFLLVYDMDEWTKVQSIPFYSIHVKKEMLKT